MAYIWPKLNGLSRLLSVAPIWCSVFAGFTVLGRQCRGWLELGYWPTIDLHDVIVWWIGRPVSSYQLEVRLVELVGGSDTSRGLGKAFMELDPVFQWFLNSVPLALWLIVIVPMVWVLSWNCRVFRLAQAKESVGDASRQVKQI
jgi:hypothetical protein